jgi:hypothetical protein
MIQNDIPDRPNPPWGRFGFLVDGRWPNKVIYLTYLSKTPNDLFLVKKREENVTL